jgi:Na+-driven multidrug efflux pump
VVNIVLDVVFLVGLKLDLRAAAWATLAAQLTQFALLLFGFRRARTPLIGCLRGLNWQRLVGNSLNGFSEFVNEVSAGLVLLAIHWLLSRADGTQGVAGFALINYSLLVNVMLACGVAEVVHVLVSQNRGAGQPRRALAFRRCGFWTVVLGGGALYGLVHFGAEPVSRWFFAQDPRGAADHARTLWPVVAPVFFLTGANLVFSAWFTGLQRPLFSALISLSRSLILPLAFIFLIVNTGGSLHFLWALPLAEAFTLLLALGLLALKRTSLTSL